jgi:hypothetical protein
MNLKEKQYQKIHDGAKSGDTISQNEFNELIKKVKPQDSQVIQDWPKAFFYDDSRINYNC